MTPTGHIAHMEEVSSAHKIFIAMRAAREIRFRLEVLKKYVSFEDVDWIQLSHYTFTTALINFRYLVFCSTPFGWLSSIVPYLRWKCF
jgi:hypothetical protein